MSGCLAGLVNPEAAILEAQDTPPINHNAVLRFRDDSVSKITGIPFKKVKVHKGIFVYGLFRDPNIMFANMYSQKVLGAVLPRSIWNLAPVKRYVAPPNFQSQLFDMVQRRVELDTSVLDTSDLPDRTISTIPMPAMLKICGINHQLEFKHKEIVTGRYTINDCNVHQTIYYPADENNIYRATLTGDQLIVESMGEYDDVAMAYVLGSFCLHPDQLGGQYEKKEQKYGKIAEIDDKIRRSLIYDFTKVFHVYSAGRFAIWKNVLMDDVLHDLRVIKEMQTKDNYEHHRRY